MGDSGRYMVAVRKKKIKNYYLTFFGSPDLDLYDPGRSGRYMVAVRKPKHSLQAQPTTAQVNQPKKYRKIKDRKETGLVHSARKGKKIVCCYYLFAM